MKQLKLALGSEGSFWEINEALLEEIQSVAASLIWYTMAFLLNQRCPSKFTLFSCFKSYATIRRTERLSYPCQYRHATSLYCLSKISLPECLRFNAPNVVCCRKAWCSLCRYHPFPLVIYYFLQWLLNGKFSLSTQVLWGLNKTHLWLWSRNCLSISKPLTLHQLQHHYPFAFAEMFVQLHPAPCLLLLLLQALRLSSTLCTPLCSASLKEFGWDPSKCGFFVRQGHAKTAVPKKMTE